MKCKRHQRIKKKKKTNNFYVNGRVFGHKKSIILIATAFVMLFSFVILTIVSIFVLKRPVLWFFSFCLTLGFYEMMRAFLFRVDDALYLCALLLGLGVVGFLETYLPLKQFEIVLTLLCFIVASMLTYLVFKQNFHLILAYFFFFVTIFNVLQVKNLISFEISIAFVVCFLVIFIVSIILSIKWRW